MARKERIHFPGAFCFVTLRRKRRRQIFRDPEDALTFYSFLSDSVERFGCRVHAFCLLTDRVNLVVEAGEIPLSRAIQNITSRYSRFFNRRHNLSGSLFRGRYRAYLFDPGVYLKEMVRYIHLSPVKTRLVDDPGHFRWSTHRAYMGEERLDWLTTSRLLGMYHVDETIARKVYERFIRDGIGSRQLISLPDERRYDSRVIGDPSFLEEHLSGMSKDEGKECTLEMILSAVARACGMTLSEISAEGKARKPSEARSMAALLVRRHSLPMGELGNLLNRNYTALSMAATRLERRMKSFPVLSERFSRLEESLNG